MRTAALAALLLLSPCLLVADDAKKADDHFVSIFDAKTLHGWKVANCEVEVQDGMIFLKAGNGWMWTEKQYGDFVLELDWKAAKANQYDSGVYIRAVATKPKQSWPAKNQINLRQDLMGNIKEIKETVPRLDLVKPGEWNHFRVTVVGTTATLEINDKLAWKIDQMKPPTGYIGLQCEVPGGGQFYFRNLRVSER